MMTIDRLEELHTLTGQFAKTAVDAGYDSTAVEFAADIRSLIDSYRLWESTEPPCAEDDYPDAQVRLSKGRSQNEGE